MRGPLPIGLADPVPGLRAALLGPTAAINFSTRLFNLLVTNFPGPQVPFYVLGRELTAIHRSASLPSAMPWRSRSSATTARSASACPPTPAPCRTPSGLPPTCAAASRSSASPRR
jgi:hypothetical protein